MLKCSLCKFFLHFMVDHGNVSLYVCIVHYIYRERDRVSSVVWAILQTWVLEILLPTHSHYESIKNVHDIGSNVGSCHL